MGTSLHEPVVAGGGENEQHQPNGGDGQLGAEGGEGPPIQHDPPDGGDETVSADLRANGERNWDCSNAGSTHHASASDSTSSGRMRSGH